MTLRFRLVLALVALVAVGLAVFGIATYTAFSRVAVPTARRPAAGLGAVRDRSALRAGVAGIRPALALRAVTSRAAASRVGPIVPSGTYAELRDPSGAVVATLQPWDSTRQPSLPDDLDRARSGPARASRPARPRARAAGGSPSPSRTTTTATPSSSPCRWTR